MAARSATATKDGRRLKVYRWGPFDAGDTFTAVDCSGYQDVTFFLLKGSAFGGNCGCTITPMSGDETPVWFTPTDTAGNAISTKTADGGWVLNESACQIKPTVAAGAAAVYAYAILRSPS